MAQNHALAGTSTAITILRNKHDPIFELIELHRRAYFVFAAHGAAVEMAENGSEKRPLKTLWPASETDKALTHGYDEGDEMEHSVKKLIIATCPYSKLRKTKKSGSFSGMQSLEYKHLFGSMVPWKARANRPAPAELR